MQNFTKILILILISLFSSGMGSIPNENTSILNTPAPDFSLEDLDGNIYTLSEYTKDNIVVISFFATWCPPCRQEIPHLLEFAKNSQKLPVKIWLINIEEGENTVKNFVQKNNINIPVLLDQKGGVARKYQVSGIPSLFVIDKSGNIVKKQVGFTPDIKEVLQEEIRSLLLEK